MPPHTPLRDDRHGVSLGDSSGSGFGRAAGAATGDWEPPSFSYLSWSLLPQGMGAVSLSVELLLNQMKRASEFLLAQSAFAVSGAGRIWGLGFTRAEGDAG